MDNDRGFIEAIQAKPNIDSLRLIYSDWLDERGDPRAEFLRLVVALNSVPAGDPRQAEMLRRKQELRPLIDPGWVVLVHRPTAEDDVREVVLRSRLEGFRSEGVYFVSLRLMYADRMEKDADPSPELLLRFAGGPYRIKPVSSAAWTDDIHSSIVDPETGQWALLLHIDELRWLDDTRCDVRCGYYAGREAGEDKVYHAELSNGRWIVTSSQGEWLA
jgi:uncharacterized protein (TIGR02996 family)